MPCYELTIEKSAKRDYEQLPNLARQRLKDVLESVSECRQPTSHEKCSMLNGQSDAYRVRAGEYRAICTLEKPELRVLRVNNRNQVYRNIEDTYQEIR